MKKTAISFITSMALVLMAGIIPAMTLTGCGSPAPDKLDPAGYPDPPEDQRHDVLPVYIAWDGAGGETWELEFSADGIIGESAPPPKPEDDEDNIYLDDELPGGRTMWFKGVSPGDVVVTFTTKNDKGKVVGVHQYAIRVFKDLKLAMLYDQYDNFR